MLALNLNRDEAALLTGILRDVLAQLVSLQRAA